MFQNRIDAGNKLVIPLEKFKNKKNVIILGLPRGGVVLGNIISQKLKLPLDVILVKKIGHPSNPEFAIGAVSMKSRIIDKDIGVDQNYIEKTTKDIRELLKKRYQLYYQGKLQLDLKNKIAIVVDDGIATGKTMIAALELIKQEKPAKIIIAVPVAPDDIIRKIEKYVDEVICLETHTPFYSIGLYYEDFTQVSDIEVIELLSK
jgi:predicted phosphoribosyltransferase